MEIRKYYFHCYKLAIQSVTSRVLVEPEIVQVQHRNAAHFRIESRLQIGNYRVSMHKDQANLSTSRPS